MPFASEWLYRRLGWRYFWAYVLFDVVSAFLITLGTLFIFNLYVDASRRSWLRAVVVTELWWCSRLPGSCGVRIGAGVAADRLAARRGAGGGGA